MRGLCDVENEKVTLNKKEGIRRKEEIIFLLGLIFGNYAE
jgi:hypothetical protein